MAEILVVDDEEILARSIVTYLERRGFSAAYAVDARSAMAMSEREIPRLVILDVRLGRDNGLDLLTWFQSRAAEAQIVVMTGHGEINMAVEAMKRGARDFLTKPAPLATIATIAANLMLHDTTRPTELRGVDRILGRSSAAVDLRAAVRRTAPALDSAVPAAVLVSGPQGAGKAAVAMAVFETARGDRGPLTMVDCSLGGAEVYRALAQRGGAILLRHVDALTSEAQTHLLATMTSPEAPWVLATSGDSLARAKGFRPDLLYRIQVGWIEVPALSDRNSDILPIAEAFARLAAQANGCDRPRLTAEARVKLVEHDWPGNLTELQNCLERAVLQARNAPIGPEHIQFLEEKGADVPNLVKMEEIALNKALSATRGNVTRAAALLGISRDTLRYRIEKYDISRPQG